MPPRAEPIRSCVVTRETLTPAELVRFAVGPDDILVPDVDGRAEGRGAWVTLASSKVEEAVKRRLFAKSLKEPVTVPDDLVAMTRLRLEQRLLSALQMARKAGQLVTGATKVRDAIDSGTVVALITASDAAEDGRNKLVGALASRRRRELEAMAGTGAEPPETGHFELLDSTQLGLALGLENVIHAALTKGAAAQSAMEKARRLAIFIAS
jgi:predicted RNA-binding protein YlxR (DUF448 family)